MITKAELDAKLLANQVEMIVCLRRQEGIKSLYDAAAFAGDGERAQQYRDELHGNLDHMLDLSATAVSLTRQLLELPR